MSTYNIVAGTTNDLAFQLLDNGTAIDLSTLTVTLLLEDRTGATVSSPGTVTVTDATNGKVKLSPTDANVFVASAGPYYARWQLQDVPGKISFVPSTNRDVWQIVGK